MQAFFIHAKPKVVIPAGDPEAGDPEAGDPVNFISS